jgi:hypothetical protein
VAAVQKLLWLARALLLAVFRILSVEKSGRPRRLVPARYQPNTYGRSTKNDTSFEHINTMLSKTQGIAQKARSNA